jgi:archaellum component FlaF (FlaF/FlaG flagellin family)
MMNEPLITPHPPASGHDSLVGVLPTTRKESVIAVLHESKLASSMRQQRMTHTMLKKLISLMVALIGLATFAAAQPRIVVSPQTIVVNPRPTFTVEVFTDKDTSGNGTPSYQIGEAISIGVRVSEAAYVYVFNIKSTGEVQQILPNRYDADGQNNYLQAGETKYFPPRGARYAFNVDGPNGLDKVIAVASRSQLNTNQLASFSNDPNFATSNIGEAGFAQTFSIVVTPIGQGDWVTDTALFYVGSRPSVPAFGSVSITSNPSGAEAFVDGQFVGFTPLTFGTRSGNHTVEVRLDGYDTFSTTVNVPGGQTASVNASLVQTVRNGTVNFTSNPSGAEVYVNGTYVGTTPTGSFSYPQGSYTVQFRLGGYNDSSLNFNVSANSNQTVRADLAPVAGSLRVRANVGGAIVFLNGQQAGTIPSGTGELVLNNLPTGTHELVVLAPGFRTFVGDFTIRGGQTTDLSVSQSRR